MKCWIYLAFLLFSCLGTPILSSAAVGDVNYISDVLNVPLRSGPSMAHRIVHRGIPSGTRLTILATDEEGEFTQVRTDGGTEGWLRTQYLVTEPIARLKLDSAQRRLKRLQASIDKERKSRTSIESDYKDAAANNQKLNAQSQALAKELEELKRISGDAINEHARNVELSKQNERLVNEVGELSATVRKLEENVERDWLMVGGGLVLLGLLLGILLKARPKRSSTYSRYS